ncbi:MAG: hypothetical protein JNL83_03290 [Myxococcales bacterium]|nr:hypothetical protein [Myxococcales bacterium]
MKRVLCAAVVAAGCGDDAPGGNGIDAGVDVDAPAAACPRMPAAADRTRHVVVAHPYTTSGAASPVFEVLDLSADGTLARSSPPRTFSLGDRAPFGVIAFTPDGQIGLAPLDNGKIGVFALDDAGTPSVVDAAFSGSFYADRIVMDASGARAWVVDSNTRENGGGIYEIAIGCDGALTDRGLIAGARSPGGLAFAGARGIMAAREVLTSASGADVHLLDWTAPPTVIGGGDAFGDDDQVFSGFALSHDAKTAFIGDSNFGGNNRVAIVGVGATAITPITVIGNITDPSGIATSPFGDVALVTSSQPPAEGIYVLDKGGPGGAWRKRGSLAYVDGAAQLPGDVAMIERGQLAGRVLVSELSRVRQVAFRASGAVDDVGSLKLPDGLEQICGAIGVTP